MNTYKLILFIGFMFLHTVGKTQTISLITPFDKDTIETFNPIFAWNYTNMGVNRDEEDYIFTLVKIENDQSANAALQVNNPILRIEGIQGFQLMYPFDAPELIVKQRYGWKIQRRINGIITHESEAWEFIIWKEIILPKKYVVLGIKESSDITPIQAEGFYFQVKSRYNSAALKISVLDAQGNEMQFELGNDLKKATEYELVETAPNCFYLKTSSFKTGVYKVIARDFRGNVYSSKISVL